MSKQLITIGKDGSIQGLDFKKRGLDLKQFGKAKIERTSEIVWCEEAQQWEIKFLHGTDAGQTATFGHAFEFVTDAQSGIDHFGFPPGAAHEPLRFDDYDKAVAGEVLLIQSAHLAGLGHRVAPVTTAQGREALAN